MYSLSMPQLGSNMGYDTNVHHQKGRKMFINSHLLHILVVCFGRFQRSRYWCACLCAWAVLVLLFSFICVPYLTTNSSNVNLKFHTVGVCIIGLWTNAFKMLIDYWSKYYHNTFRNILILVRNQILLQNNKVYITQACILTVHDLFISNSS